MFLLNSCLGRFSAAALAALLLPKLRSHFAEFLNNTSPAGLRILSSSTCVGLRYGPRTGNSGFSRQEGAAASLLHFAPHHAFALCHVVFPPWRLPRLHRFSLSRLRLSFCVPTVLSYDSTGISTCCPSTTSFDLALGPDFPRADQLYPGNLGYSAWRIPTSISLLIPAFSLPGTPLLLIGTASPRQQCSSTDHTLSMIPELRCRVSAPDIFGAGPLDQ